MGKKIKDFNKADFKIEKNSISAIDDNWKDKFTEKPKIIFNQTQKKIT